MAWKKTRFPRITSASAACRAHPASVWGANAMKWTSFLYAHLSVAQGGQYSVYNGSKPFVTNLPMPLNDFLVAPLLCLFPRKTVMGFIVQTDYACEVEDRQLLGTLSALSNDVLSHTKVLRALKLSRQRCVSHSDELYQTWITVSVACFRLISTGGTVAEWKELERAQVCLRAGFCAIL